MSGSLENVNPLLQIDTGFRSYLNAYTRSFQNHVVDGQLDYAFESDFAVRQKIIGLGGWSKLAKAVNTADISAEAKHLFMKCDQAGALKYPEIYEIVKKCAERLEFNLPIVFIRTDIEKPLVYSIASDLIDPCIVLSEWTVKSCPPDELTLLIGSECGRLQNNHSAFNWAFTYLNYNRNVYLPVERSYKAAVNNQLVRALVEWVRFADITADRAAMICLDEPGRFCEIVCSLYNRGFVDFYGRAADGLSAAKLSGITEGYAAQQARDIRSDSALSELEKRILASSEFLSCEALFEWRRDIGKPEKSVMTTQNCDVRSAIILGTGGQ